ncbi:MAG: 3-hydroxybutyryl-CoA dehydrogenase [Gemmatimonadaceae bacterium]|nr:3-hydroxybutyryl-CoA dehydrogenase [Gemmatimonadaceae bacterium]
MVVGVIGAGAMGSGIAQVAATAGHRVVLGDTHKPAIERARELIMAALTRDVTKARIDQATADAICGRISDAGDLAMGFGAFAECGIVIEAVAEDLDVKMAVFDEVESEVSPECILATNTSSLPVTAIAGQCRHPQRVIGIHFFNPAVTMPLVEIIPAITTDTAVTDSARALVDGWKKVTVIARDTPGFIVNRIARPFYGESLRLLEEGIADAPTIDWALRDIAGFRMGPFELMDFIGHDINFAVTRSVYDGFFQDPRYRPSITQQRLVEAGRFGRKRSRGFYDYSDGAVRPKPVQDAALGQVIVNRVLAMLINEAVDAVYLGVASPADIELSMTRGVNYPKGLLAWGDAIGPANVLAQLDALREEYGEDRYRASVLLRRIVRDGGRLLASHGRAVAGEKT